MNNFEVNEMVDVVADVVEETKVVEEVMEAGTKTNKKTAFIVGAVTVSVAVVGGIVALFAKKKAKNEDNEVFETDDDEENIDETEEELEETEEE